MAYVSIDVDLDEFEISEIANHIRRKKRSGRSTDQAIIRELIVELTGGRKDMGPDKLSKVDQWKNELWPAIRERFTLEQLEAFLNS